MVNGHSAPIFQSLLRRLLVRGHRTSSEQGKKDRKKNVPSMVFGETICLPSPALQSIGRKQNLHWQRLYFRRLISKAFPADNYMMTQKCRSTQILKYSNRKLHRTRNSVDVYRNLLEGEKGTSPPTSYMISRSAK